MDKKNYFESVSHEIKTPMNAILGLTDIAMDSMDDPVKLQDCISKIAYSTKHLANIINDMLDMSAIENGSLELNNEEFEFAAVVDYLISTFYSEAKKKKISFDVLLVNEIPKFIIGDEARLVQVLYNIVSNALKFTEPLGSVLLTVENKGIDDGRIHLQFLIKDTGVGMSKMDAKLVYVPFETFAPETIENSGGTGLGLTITKHIVSLMDGSIAFESKEGEGTTVTVDVFLGCEDEGKIASEFVGLNVLVGAKTDITCLYLKTVLEQMGCNVVTAKTGAAITKELKNAIANKDEIDICFLDEDIPKVNFYSFVKKLREDETLQSVTIIAMTYDYLDVTEGISKIGINELIKKPTNGEALYNSILKTMGRKINVKRSKKQGFNFLGKKIMVVEDNGLNMEITVELLKKTGAIAVGVTDGDEAVELFAGSKTGEYDLILMDIRMPRMNGYEATRAIRALDHPDAKKIPIVALSANAFRTDVQAAFDSGMNAYIGKPVDIQELYDTLQKQF